MAEQKEEVLPEVPDEDDEPAGYKPPALKSLDEIKNLDQDDPSLQKYKETLLGSGGNVVVDESCPLNCIVRSLSMVTDDRKDVVIDLGGDLSNLKKEPITIKEGVRYRLKIQFHVQREIITGLKYIQTSYRKGIRVDKSTFMVGSYGPKAEMQEFLTPWEDAPSGMLLRGKYHVKSQFTDDDKHDFLTWEWYFDIKKDWGE